MVKGYHTLASGMLTQSRNLNVISNNMANTATPGFKKDQLISTTFKEQLLFRTGNKNKSNPAELGKVSMIRAASEVATNFNTGSYEETNRVLDFAILGDGFFAIQPYNNAQAQGEAEGENAEAASQITYTDPVYTRNGSFSVDEEGYLALSHAGRVIGAEGPIFVGTDQFHVDNQGNLYGEDNVLLGAIAPVEFVDRNQLIKTGEGMYQNQDDANIAQEPTSALLWKNLERSNVEPTQEMTAMMTSQRALQSASQIIKIYDQLLQKTVTDIGRVI